MAKLDRILINTAFEQQYPLASVRSAPRASSDHTPLIIDFGLNVTQKPMPFRFEKWWLEREDFHELISKIWNTPCHYADPLDTWQFKVRLLRKKVKGWAINVNAKIRKKKNNLLSKLDLLDIKYEAGSLAEGELDVLRSTLEELESI